MLKLNRTPFTIFQAPPAMLAEHVSRLWTNTTGPETIRAEYYLPVWRGEIASLIPGEMNNEDVDNYVLEQIFADFNADRRPVNYAGHSLSVGDVVQLGERFFICAVVGFRPVRFKTGGEVTPLPLRLPLPGGATLRATAHPEGAFPCISIDLLEPNDEENKVCFAEYNPEKPAGHELCVGVYCDCEDDTVYYDSYVRGEGSI